VTYVLLLERLERQVLSERQVAAALAAGGAEDVEMPDLDTSRAEFDAALVAEPAPESTSVRLMRELGVA